MYGQSNHSNRGVPLGAKVGQVLINSEAEYFEYLSLLATPAHKHTHGFRYHIPLTVLALLCGAYFIYIADLNNLQKQSSTLKLLLQKQQEQELTASIKDNS